MMTLLRKLERFRVKKGQGVHNYAYVAAPRAILFDWSGTLISVGLSAHVELMHRVLKNMGYYAISITGANPLDQIKQVVQSRYTEFLVLCNRELEKSAQSGLLIADYVTEMLSLFKQRGIYLAIVSNKNKGSLLHEVELAGLRQFFNKIVGYDSNLMLKPSPAPVFAALGDIVPSEEVFFVGDSETDIECARNAGCLPISYGDPGSQCEGVLSFANFREFTVFVLGLLEGVK